MNGMGIFKSFWEFIRPYIYYYYYNLLKSFGNEKPTIKKVVKPEKRRKIPKNKTGQFCPVLFLGVYQ